jgi:predicted enzyme related to lactoylglutathione lyase
MISINSSNTILYCQHWEEMIDFYKTKLQLNVACVRDWFIEFDLNNTSRLSIADESRASIKSSNGRGITISLEVNDITAVHTSLLEKGLCPLQIKDHPWGAKVFYIFDPEGNRLEFWSSING